MLNLVCKFIQNKTNLMYDQDAKIIRAEPINKLHKLARKYIPSNPRIPERM